MLVFSVHLHAFPISGFGRGFAGHLYSLFLPALTIALGFSTVLVRSLRAATIATLQAEFVDTARMKGIRWRGCCGGTCSATPCWPWSRCSA